MDNPAPLPPLEVGDLVLVLKRYDEHDHATGRVRAIRQLEFGGSSMGTVVEVEIPDVGVRTFARCHVTRHRGMADAQVGGDPKVGDLVEICIDMPDNGIRRGQLGRVICIDLTKLAGAWWDVSTIGTTSTGVVGRIEVSITRRHLHRIGRAG